MTVKDRMPFGDVELRVVLGSNSYAAVGAGTQPPPASDEQQLAADSAESSPLLLSS